jgi:hypothetical protein
MLRFLHSIPKARLRSWLNRSGAILLLLGFGASCLIWRAENRAELEIEAQQAASPGAPLPLLDSRKNVRNLEIYSGKAGVLIEKASEMFRGKPLTKVASIVTIVVSSLLFCAAARLRG